MRAKVGVVTKSHSLFVNLDIIVSGSAVQFEVYNLRPVLEHDSPVAPFDSSPCDMIVPSFDQNDAAHLPVMVFLHLVDEDDQIAHLQITLCRSPF